MGTQVEYTFPAFTSATNRGLLVDVFPDFIQNHTLDGGQRFIAAAFVGDRPGVLIGVVRLLGSPLLVGLPDGATVEVRFSIEGSIAMSVGENALMAFVVRSLDDGSEGAPRRSSVRAALRAAIVEAVREPAESGDPKDRVRVLNFEPKEETLFHATRLVEYLLVASRSSVEPLRDLSRAIGDICTAAGEADIPVAYVHYPTEVGQVGDDALVARVALAMPDRASHLFPAEWAAVKAASRYKLGLQQYRPTISSSSPADHKYEEIVNFMGVGGPSPASQGVSLNGAKRGIFVVGDARTGFVASMLSSGRDVLEGGCMTVVGGHTIAGWVCPEESADLVLARLKESLSQSDRVISRRASSAPQSSRQCQGEFWLAWRVPDAPRIFYEAISGLDAAAGRVLPAGSSLEYAYAVSRVVKGGACSGKVKVRLMGSATVDVAGMVKSLRSELKTSGYWSDLLQSHPSSSRVDLRIQVSEPTEDPWALLVPVFNAG